MNIHHAINNGIVEEITQIVALINHSMGSSEGTKIGYKYYFEVHFCIVYAHSGFLIPNEQRTPNELTWFVIIANSRFYSSWKSWVCHEKYYRSLEPYVHAMHA